MKIKRLSWKNYKGLMDGAISANGDDVTVSGRNGAGKSSIASILPFILFGKVVGSLKRYENGLTKSGGVHAAEVEFEDGTTLRRELHDARLGGTTAKLFIDGVSVKKATFDATIMNLTHGAGELVINPFAFCALPPKNQREILLQKFGALSEAEYLRGRDEEKLFGGYSASTFIAQCKSDLKPLKAEATQIPARIEELERQLQDMPSDFETAERNLDLEIGKLMSERKELQNANADNMRGEIERLKSTIETLEFTRDRVGRFAKNWQEEREKLLSAWKRVKASKPGLCPTCGQRMPLEKFTATRDAELAKTVAEGKRAAKEINDLQTQLSKLNEDIAKAKEQHRKLSAKLDVNETAKREARVEWINAELSKLTEQATALKLARKQRERIIELKRREKELNQRITDLEGRIAQAEMFQQEFIGAVEKAINSRFEFVKFKLFDYLVTTGEIKPTCEAMIDGVPYTSLSKGEKLRAAMDIFRALQQSYDVELPIMIDDAESYNVWTLADLPTNQLWLFRVTEEALTIEVERRLGAA